MTEQTAQNPEQDDLVPGTPEYNEAMAAKFREAKESGSQYPETLTESSEDKTDETDEKPQVPEGIPPKFVREDGTVDYEALAKSYVELEKMRSQKADDKPKEKAEAGSEGDGTSDDSEAAQAASEAGLDIDTLREKVNTQGSLDDSDYEALEKVGISREIVDEYIALRQREYERTRADALDYIGGEEAANDLMQWAAQNLSEEEIDAYNGMLAGPSWKAAVDTLRTLRGDSKPSAKEPRLKSASGSPSGTPTGYLTPDDRKADMANPLYHKPGAEGDKFRAEVQRKTLYAAWRRS